MPAKRRYNKRRTSESAELVAWSELFECGYDFFSDLADWGFPGGDSDRKSRAAAPEAWQRLGAKFMEGWKPHGPVEKNFRQLPWAFEEFGKPWEARRAR